MKKNNIIIVGAGIVGLATALRLLKKNPKVRITILEKEAGPARHQTGNNSGVIHAGVYYKPGSLKAQNCLKGYKQLIEFCNKENIKYELCGKLIVATNDEELIRLDALHSRSMQNGLDKVLKIKGESIREYEPYASGSAALYVPYTGIIDYKEVSQKYLEIIQNRYGAQVCFNTAVRGVIKKSNSIEVHTTSESYEANFLINTAGLFSDRIALMTEDTTNVRIIPFRGEYVELRKEKAHLVNNLIYPVPDPKFPFLGVHFTRMIHGGIEAGPNAVWAFRQEGYKKTSFNAYDVARSLSWPGFRKVMGQYWKMGMGEYWRSYNKKALARALSKLVPEVTAKDLVTGGAGVRAQACDRKGGLIDDFLITENKWAINVLNAPSPAATASLAIGDTVSDLALKRIR